MMTSILFVLGFIFLITGIFMQASSTNFIKIKNISFDSETLGFGLAMTGGILTFLMLLAKGFVWMSTVTPVA